MKQNSSKPNWSELYRQNIGELLLFRLDAVRHILRTRSYSKQCEDWGSRGSLLCKREETARFEASVTIWSLVKVSRYPLLLHLCGPRCVSEGVRQGQCVKGDQRENGNVRRVGLVPYGTRILICVRLLQMVVYLEQSWK
jgi:hypothetical protein